MRLIFASYNIHKAVGVDRRRDPDRIMAVLHELDADIVALQEADMRFGNRSAVLPRRLLDERHWHVAPLAMRPAGMAWHGNAIIVRRGIEILGAQPIALPTLEPRGAVCARLRFHEREFLVVGVHLDLSGLLRRQQIQTVCADVRHRSAPAVLMGDLNEWSVRGGALKAFGPAWKVLGPGRSFPSRNPLAQLDRIAHTSEWSCDQTGVHHSALAAVASDHLPVKASLTLAA